MILPLIIILVRMGSCYDLVFEILVMNQNFAYYFNYSLQVLDWNKQSLIDTIYTNIAPREF